MKHTRKDAAQQETYRTVLNVISNSDGGYEISINGVVVGSHIPERCLDAEGLHETGILW